MCCQNGQEQEPFIRIFANDDEVVPSLWQNTELHTNSPKHANSPSFPVLTPQQLWSITLLILYSVNHKSYSFSTLTFFSRKCGVLQWPLFFSTNEKSKKSNLYCNHSWTSVPAALPEDTAPWRLDVGGDNLEETLVLCSAVSWSHWKEWQWPPVSCCLPVCPFPLGMDFPPPTLQMTPIILPQ